MSVVAFPDRAGRTKAQQIVQDVYRQAIHDAFNRAMTEAAQVKGADFRMSDFMEAADQVLAEERQRIADVRPMW